DGFGVIGSISATNGEFLVNNRRVVFVKGTAAAELAKTAKKGDRFHLTGMPPISLKLVPFRVKHRDELRHEHRADPLGWRLPDEMIVGAGVPLPPAGDD